MAKMALFSVIKWPCFQLTKARQEAVSCNGKSIGKEVRLRRRPPSHAPTWVRLTRQAVDNEAQAV
jgi:hypothetical protein